MAKTELDCDACKRNIYPRALISVDGNYLTLCVNAKECCKRYREVDTGQGMKLLHTPEGYAHLIKVGAII